MNDFGYIIELLKKHKKFEKHRNKTIKDNSNIIKMKVKLKHDTELIEKWESCMNELGSSIFTNDGNFKSLNSLFSEMNIILTNKVE